MPDYREVDEDFKTTKDKDIIESHNAKKEDANANIIEDDSKDDYEEICYMCRRPESIAGKMIHIPMENVCMCIDCMERSFNKIGRASCRERV